MAHHHHHSGHHHERDDGRGRLLTALIILGGFTLIEALGGYLANSIALLAEAAHMLADSAALVLAIIAVGAARRCRGRARSGR